MTSFVVYPRGSSSASASPAFWPPVRRPSRIRLPAPWGSSMPSSTGSRSSRWSCMSVTSVREIGVRKAIGASDGQIVGQFLTESGVIGLIGGVSGLFLGWMAATVTDMLLEPRNLDLFLVTPRLALGSVAFAIILGLVSGLYPSSTQLGCNLSSPTLRIRSRTMTTKTMEPLVQEVAQDRPIRLRDHRSLRNPGHCREEAGHTGDRHSQALPHERGQLRRRASGCLLRSGKGRWRP